MQWPCDFRHTLLSSALFFSPLQDAVLFEARLGKFMLTALILGTCM
jgi:hypothetical protein